MMINDLLCLQEMNSRDLMVYFNKVILFYYIIKPLAFIYLKKNKPVY